MADFNSYLLAVAKAEPLGTSSYSSSCDFSVSPNQRLYCTTARENCSFCVAQRFSTLRSELSYHSGLQFPRYLPQLFPSSHGETESPGAALFAIQALSREDRATVRNLFQRWPPI